MKYIVFFLVLAIIPVTLFSAEVTRTGYVLQYKIQSEGNTDKISFVCLIPGNIENAQKVLNIEYSKSPERIFTKNGNRYAEFEFLKLEKTVKLIIDVDIEIYRCDFATIKKKEDFKPTTILTSDFLIKEKYIEIDDPLIKTLAPRLKHKDTLKTVLNTYTLVKSNLNYTKMNKTIGAKEVLNTKEGDCSEFSDLFVTLCRANNIPSRVVKGIVIDYSKTPYHAWAEVYTQKYGWIRVEPTTNTKSSFVRLRNKYIQLSTVRNDKLLNYRSFSNYRYWGDPVKLKHKIKIK